MEVLITIAAMTSAKLDLLAEVERSNQRYHDLVAAHAKLSLDATSRKSLEAELFNARKLEAVGRLTGRFAHEFNNLLTVVLGNLEFLDEVIGDAPFADSLRAAQTAAQRGGDLIASMLAYSQRTRLSPEVVDLNILIRENLEIDVMVQNGSVAMDLANDLSAINVDPKILKTVMLQLISNAQHAMTPQDREVFFVTQNVAHTLSDNQPLATQLPPGNYVCLSVRDCGVGISPQDLQQIFDPFYTTKPVGSGLGLGLSLTLGFMQQSGGSVAVHSYVGEGSTFQLYFPAVTPNRNDLLTIDS